MGIEIPKPFSQPICLVPDTRIAGTTHVDDIDELAPKLSVGERLALVREKDNKYDEWRIRVNTSAGGRLGFVPADINKIPARLMDGGKALYAEVNKVEKVGGWGRRTMKARTVPRASKRQRSGTLALWPGFPLPCVRGSRGIAALSRAPRRALREQSRRFRGSTRGRRRSIIRCY